jgi:TolB-like protein
MIRETKIMKTVIFYLTLVLMISETDAQTSKTAKTDWDLQIDVLVRQIDNEIPAHSEKVKIAVVDFSDLQGNVNNFGRFLSEELITRLFQLKKFTVVERLLLERVMEENALQLTGVVDPKSAVELGKILGVKAIVSGTITDLESTMRINARLISTETGEVFAAANVTITKDETVKKLVGDVLEGKPKPVMNKDPKATSSIPSGQPGLKGEYYNLPPFSGSPTIPTGNPTFTRVDPTISFNWGYDSPAPKISADYFYIRWTGNIYIETTGSYVFCVGTYDRGFGRYFCRFTYSGVRLSVNNRSLIERWVESSEGNPVTIFLQGNQWYPIQLEVFDQNSEASCYLFWQPPGESEVSIVPSTVLRTE